MSKIPVEYSTNNSGGSYWLSDEDWTALENAGWKTFGFGDTAFRNGNHIPDADGLPSRKEEVPSSQQDADHFSSAFSKNTKQYAYKLFDSISDALREFEDLTGEDVTAEGCNCCGAPHSFTWGRDIIVRLPKERLDEQDYNYASGEELLEYLYPDRNTTLSKRELLERAS